MRGSMMITCTGTGCGQKGQPVVHLPVYLSTTHPEWKDLRAHESLHTHGNPAVCYGVHAHAMLVSTIRPHSSPSLSLSLCMLQLCKGPQALT